MVIALDTNIVVDFLNGNENVTKKVIKYQKIYIPITVLGELLFGVKNSTKKNENLNKLQSFISKCIILNSNSLVADEYSNIRKELKDIGKPIPENDIWIAAICKNNDISIASRDKHFENIKNLKLEIWN